MFSMLIPSPSVPPEPWWMWGMKQHVSDHRKGLFDTMWMGLYWVGAMGMSYATQILPGYWVSQDLANW